MLYFRYLSLVGDCVNYLEGKCVKHDFPVNPTYKCDDWKRDPKKPAGVC